MKTEMKIMAIFALALVSFTTLSRNVVFAKVSENNEIRKETDANIYGHVIDKETGEHLPYISVVVKGTTIATMTDASGHYFLKNLPVGKLTIEVSSIGYFPVTKTVVVKGKNTQEYNFELLPDKMALNEVVVSANRNETIRQIAPNIVNVIDTKLMNVTHSTNLAQGLNFQPGVRVEDNCQNCGFSQVRINGLDGHYSQILIDSRPIFSALNGVYGLEQIPANMIERVEVVRGGGSALFGASAIGGTINIITKEPTRNTASFAHDISAIGGFHSYDNNTMMNASLVTNDNNMGFYVYGQNRHRAGYDKDNDGYTELPVLDNKTVGFQSFFRINDHSKITVDYHGLNEFRRGGNLLNRPPHEANIAEQIEHNINGGGLTYTLFSLNDKHKFNAYFSFQDTKRKTFYGGTQETNTDDAIAEARKAYGRTRDLTLVSGLQYVYKMDRLWFMPANLTLGSEFNYDDLKDEIIDYQHLTKQSVNTVSVYAQNEWTNKVYTILLGARVDKHTLVKHPIISPRVNLRYNPNMHINLRASYAGGFRAPQTFDEDLHVTLVGGERMFVRMAKDLKEEYAHSFSFSSDMYEAYGPFQGNLLIEGFYTRLNNVFALRTLEEKDSNGDFINERYNAYGANVFGVNIEGKVVYKSWVELQGGMTFQRSRYTEPISWNDNAPKEKKMMRTPDVYGYFTAKINPKRRFNVAFSGTYTGPMLVGRAEIETGPYKRDPLAVTTPSFFTLDMKLAYHFKLYDSVNLELSGGIKNMFNSYQKDFDKGWSRASDYIYGPSLPRTMYLGIKFNY